MISFSTGLKLATLGYGGFGYAMMGGCIRVYSGERPENADAAIPKTPLAHLLGHVTTEGKKFSPGSELSPGGLTFTLNQLGDLKNEHQWIFSCIRGGEPAWFRWVWSMQDNDIESQFYPRVDGDVGIDGDLVIPYPFVLVGQKISFNYFLMKLPI